MTETLYVLAVKQPPAFVPTEIHLITTGKGAEHARLNLLPESIGWFHRLRQDWQLPEIASSPRHIHIIPGQEGSALEDIRDDNDNTRAADFITARVADRALAQRFAKRTSRRRSAFFRGCCGSSLPAGEH